jgi:hypothetical protein
MSSEPLEATPFEAGLDAAAPKPLAETNPSFNQGWLKWAACFALASIVVLALTVVSLFVGYLTELTYELNFIALAGFTFCLFMGTNPQPGTWLFFACCMINLFSALVLLLGIISSPYYEYLAVAGLLGQFVLFPTLFTIGIYTSNIFPKIIRTTAAVWIGISVVSSLFLAIQQFLGNYSSTQDLSNSLVSIAVYCALLGPLTLYIMLGEITLLWLRPRAQSKDHLPLADQEEALPSTEA